MIIDMLVYEYCTLYIHTTRASSTTRVRSPREPGGVFVCYMCSYEYIILHPKDSWSRCDRDFGYFGVDFSHDSGTCTTAVHVSLHPGDFFGREESGPFQ